MSELDRTVAFLDRALAQIESRLDEPDIPLPVLEDFKQTLDGTRTVVQAILGAGKPSEYERNVRRFRMRNAAQLCQSVLFGLLDGSIDPTTPGMTELQATVGETLQHLDAFAGGSDKRTR